MTITSSGVKCNVCGYYILGLTPDDTYTPFKLSIFKNELHGCKVCIQIIKELDGKDWKSLPDGPLRKEYERIEHERDR